jgi:hypothetical protein
MVGEAPGGLDHGGTVHPVRSGSDLATQAGGAEVETSP